MTHKPTWKVLLIGGGSGVGKTFLTKRLAKHFKCPYLKVDNLRYFIQNVLKDKFKEFPELFPNIKSENDNITSNHFKIAKFIKPGLNALIEKYAHYEETPAMIIEGIEILPKTLELNPSENLQGIFLFDTLDNLIRKMEERGRGKLRSSEYKEKARNSMDFINLVVKEAKLTGFPTLSVDPESTLVNRAIDLLEQSDPQQRS
jgi:2-phosphoglycerate kinase